MINPHAAAFAFQLSGKIHRSNSTPLRASFANLYPFKSTKKNNNDQAYPESHHDITANFKPFYFRFRRFFISQMI